MPNYTFFNEQSGIEWDQSMSMSDRETFISEHPHIKQGFNSMNIVGGVGGIKNDDGWGEDLHKVSSEHPDSALAASMGSKMGVKEVKTRQAVEKWRRKRAAKGDALGEYLYSI